MEKCYHLEENSRKIYSMYAGFSANHRIPKLFKKFM